MKRVAMEPNPFVEDPKNHELDRLLVTQILSGSQDALEQLIEKHRRWIYNIAFRMVMTAQDAEDVTQEVLVKIITKLSSFDPEKGRFRTWLYRIVSNHVINMKTRGFEASVDNIENYYTAIQGIPDQDPEDTPETQLLTTDLAISCVMGTLLCLDRRQRLAFILAIGFNVTDQVGAEVMEISKSNFRKILSRARDHLHHFMDQNCGMYNSNATCRCRKKILSIKAAGGLSAENLQFYKKNTPMLRDLIGNMSGAAHGESSPEHARLFRDHPFYKGTDKVMWLKDLLKKESIQKILQFELSH